MLEDSALLPQDFDTSGTGIRRDSEYNINRGKHD
jgi:hypothetical protein